MRTGLVWSGTLAPSPASGGHAVEVQEGPCKVGVKVGTSLSSWSRGGGTAGMGTGHFGGQSGKGRDRDVPQEVVMPAFASLVKSRQDSRR